MFRRSASAVGLKRPGYGMRHHPGCSNDGSCRHCGVAHHLWLQMWLSRYRCIYLYLDMYISFNINVNSCIHTIFTCVDIYTLTLNYIFQKYYVNININIYITVMCVCIYIYIYLSLRPYHSPAADLLLCCKCAFDTKSSFFASILSQVFPFFLQ